MPRQEVKFTWDAITMQMQNSLIQANRYSKVKILLYPDSAAISGWTNQGAKYPWLLHAEQICLLNKYQSAKQPRVKYTDLVINLNKLSGLDSWVAGSPRVLSGGRKREAREDPMLCQGRCPCPEFLRDVVGSKLRKPPPPPEGSNPGAELSRWESAHLLQPSCFLGKCPGRDWSHSGPGWGRLRPKGLETRDNVSGPIASHADLSIK